MYYSATHPSPVGLITMASDGNSLVGLWLEGQKYFGLSVPGEREDRGDLPIFGAARQWLDRYFAGGRPDVSGLALAPSGSDFRKSVWQILCGIPHGEVMTYGEIAKKIGCKSAQAVGGAVGHNPISIIIPCHRVVGANGSLTGYAGGLDIKEKLLTLEGIRWP
ncbi:MAG: methylated-DNA--[protein]-cysteine S-methyltransferase [Defluviitaleaceae bacterium]|nr:methylated-DNA--[protein]-cysteine S-methyltransferase [Defluviitaleaceae bacterium]MCL2238789.1 methylated-DNA--[protein]-cysteine S-methyltransferase [Defluviitaleaceae bacterium]